MSLTSELDIAIKSQVLQRRAEDKEADNFLTILYYRNRNLISKKPKQ